MLKEYKGDFAILNKIQKLKDERLSKITLQNCQDHTSLFPCSGERQSRITLESGVRHVYRTRLF